MHTIKLRDGHEIPQVGLGLSIARTIVEANGGRLHAENRPGGGAVFRIEWPATDAKAKPSVETG